MLKLISVGLLSALFFSTTFILNRYMSLEGGHWVWSATLRYAYMIMFLIIWISITKGFKEIVNIFKLFFHNWTFWTITGSIGFGLFYSLCCFSADYSSGWVIATTWQLTIIMSLFVLMFFGRKFPKRVWVFSLIIFSGVIMVNLSEFDTSNIKHLLLGALPVMLATLCYPVGNQLVWEAQNGNKKLPKLNNPLIQNPFNKVLLMSLGSVPFWILLLIVTTPSVPSTGQIINTAIVALFSGVIATSLFLYARGKAKDATELAAVDSTQSSEVIFAMLGEMILLNSSIPNSNALIGIIIVFAGLLLFLFAKKNNL
ncbi:MAG: multidrug resistance efflux transporter family protein [Desulfobacterales bacterium]|nr:multidrug resistance efflux transporter family protein [Desulfobacterales bacterium]MCP4159086.1 multidrug resistance efflux transporter family protein [Deltaproteobacteria bacterium]